MRRARILSGLIIFLFLLMHTLNHSMGLISVRAADQARPLLLAVWRSAPGTFLLYGSFVVHIVLVLRTLYIRRSLSMPNGEAIQILLGLLVPVLIIDHILSTRVASTLFHLRDSYETIVHLLWSKSPRDGVIQSIALIVIWAHGCLGIHFWLRHRAWYVQLWPWILTFAILVPTLSLLGFAQMGRTLANPTFPLSGFPGGTYDPTLLPAGAADTLRDIKAVLYSGLAGALFFVLAARLIRWLKARAHLVTIRYITGEVISVPRGFTVLEASRVAGKAHYAVCGGKGRCSTCRVQIIDGQDNLPPPDQLESHTLERIHAEPGVRLACQLRPTGTVTLSPILVALPQTQGTPDNYEAIPGREREIAILFCDIRNFTSLSESRLPFDIVFLLNRYFAVVGSAVEAAGGRVDKFIGDGAMALFGISEGMDEGCRQAVRAAAAIMDGVDELNRQMAQDLTVPLRVAIGIHAGSAVVGTLGYGQTRNLTAIGDTVNVASRMEATAKELDMPLVISEPVASCSGVDTTGADAREITVRGRTIPLKIFVLNRPAVG
nr:adenylate/guanylate cyclase domain-containing protein [Rhizobium sp. SSA_523]